MSVKPEVWNRFLWFFFTQNHWYSWKSRDWSRFLCSFTPDFTNSRKSRAWTLSLCSITPDFPDANENPEIETDFFHHLHQASSIYIKIQRLKSISLIIYPKLHWCQWKSRAWNRFIWFFFTPSFIDTGENPEIGADFFDFFYSKLHWSQWKSRGWIYLFAHLLQISPIAGKIQRLDSPSLIIDSKLHWSQWKSRGWIYFFARLLRTSLMPRHYSNENVTCTYNKQMTNSSEKRGPDSAAITSAERYFCEGWMLDTVGRGWLAASIKRKAHTYKTTTAIPLRADIW